MECGLSVPHHQYFYPRSPCGERRGDYHISLSLSSNFYPRSPCGERRRLATASYSITADFYPRSPCGERRNGKGIYVRVHPFLSTLSLRRATRLCTVSFFPYPIISIHALLAESDAVASCAVAVPCIFLSTLSLRRATRPTSHGKNHKQHFYPRSPCGERPADVAKGKTFTSISIHALLAESD